MKKFGNQATMLRKHSFKCHNERRMRRLKELCQTYWIFGPPQALSFLLLLLPLHRQPVPGQSKQFLYFFVSAWIFGHFPCSAHLVVGLPPSKKVLQRRIAKKEPPAGGEGVPFCGFLLFFWRWQTKRKIRTYKQKLQLVTSSPFLQSCSWRLCQVTAAATKDAAVPVAVPSVGIPRVVKQFNVEGAGLPGSRVAQNQPRFTTISLVTRKWIENGIGFAAKIQFWTLIQIHHHHYL